MSRSRGSNGGSDVGVQVWSLFLRTHTAVVRRLERELQQHGGVPLGWYDVLLELSGAPERRLRMQQLGERAVLSRTRVSRIVDELCGAGLVRREADPADKRGSFAVLTPAGRQAFRAAAPVYLRGITEHFAGHLSEVELATLERGLTRVLAAQESDPAVRA